MDPVERAGMATATGTYNLVAYIIAFCILAGIIVSRLSGRPFTWMKGCTLAIFFST